MKSALPTQPTSKNFMDGQILLWLKILTTTTTTTTIKQQMSSCASCMCILPGAEGRGIYMYDVHVFFTSWKRQKDGRVGEWYINYCQQAAAIKDDFERWNKRRRWAATKIWWYLLLSMLSLSSFSLQIVSEDVAKYENSTSSSSTSLLISLLTSLLTSSLASLSHNQEKAKVEQFLIGTSLENDASGDRQNLFVSATRETMKKINRTFCK